MDMAERTTQLVADQQRLVRKAATLSRKLTHRSYQRRTQVRRAGEVRAGVESLLNAAAEVSNGDPGRVASLVQQIAVLQATGGKVSSLPSVEEAVAELQACLLELFHVSRQLGRVRADGLLEGLLLPPTDGLLVISTPLSGGRVDTQSHSAAVGDQLRGRYVLREREKVTRERAELERSKADFAAQLAEFTKQQEAGTRLVHELEDIERALSADRGALEQDRKRDGDERAALREEKEHLREQQEEVAACKQDLDDPLKLLSRTRETVKAAEASAGPMTEKVKEYGQRLATAGEQTGQLKVQTRDLGRAVEEAEAELTRASETFEKQRDLAAEQDGKAAKLQAKAEVAARAAEKARSKHDGLLEKRRASEREIQELKGQVEARRREIAAMEQELQQRKTEANGFDERYRELAAELETVLGTETDEKKRKAIKKALELLRS